MPSFRPAFQIYTIRHTAPKDFPEMCRRLAGMGYKGAELTDMRGIMPAADLKQLGTDCGLTWLSVHVALEEMESKLDSLMEYYRSAGITRLVCPWLHPRRRKTRCDWVATAESLGKIARRMGSAGMTLIYHHHDFEFHPIRESPADGGGFADAFDLLDRCTPEQSLKFELDTYWLEFVGIATADFIGRYPHRLALLHCKDMAVGPERRYAPLGAGRLNWPHILSAVQNAGLDWLIVEQDECYGRPPVDCLAQSLTYLKQFNYGIITPSDSSPVEDG